MSAFKSTVLCRVCNVQVPKSGMSGHCRGKKHNFLLPEEISVRGEFSESDVPQLDEYFSQFGQILTSDAKESDAGFFKIVYSFAENATYNKIINSEHVFNDKPLSIKWTSGRMKREIRPDMTLIQARVPRTRFVNDAGDQELVISKEIKLLTQKLEKGETFADQISILISELKDNDEKVKRDRELIRHDLTQALRSSFRNVKIHFFGSSVTGLDFKGSDLDIYIEGVKTPRASEADVLKRIRSHMFRCRQFCDILLIGGAKVPIIKCIHTKTQICCDVNVKNMLSVANSELIKYYFGLDEKLPALMIALKYWGKTWGFKRPNFITSYALCMMMIFYLQQEPYNAPSVFELQAGAGNNLQDGWNCAFKRLNYVNDKLKEVSLLELFKGFFLFYSTFDYVSQLVCPYLGRPMEKIYFIKPADGLPDCYSHFKTVILDQHSELQLSSKLCIQDPFEHNRNVCRSPTVFQVGKFMGAIRATAQLLSDSGSFISILLDPTQNPLSYKSMLEFTVSKSATSVKSDEEWFDLVKQLTVRILQEVLCLELTPNVSKKKDVNQSSDFSYFCSGVYNIWFNRVGIHKNLMVHLPNDISPLDQEVAVSKCIVTYFQEKSLSKTIFNMFFERDPCRVRIVFSTKNSTMPSRSDLTAFPQMSSYLYVKMPIFIEIADKGVNFDFTQKIQEVLIAEGNKAGTNNADTNPTQNTPPPKMIKPGSLAKDDKTPTSETDAGLGANTTSQINNQDATADITSKETTRKDSDGEMKDEEDEEDVPPDFFDDFANEDFMDGLDIVDAWDDEVVDDDSGEQSKSVEKNKERSVADSEPEKQSSGRVTKGFKFIRRTPLKRRHKDRSSSRGRRSKSRSKKRAVDRRRDPEKTKRDINKDKLIKSKDKEQKLVSDQLNLVQTGLVPPGTEMDVDINAVLKSSRSLEKSCEKLLEKSQVSRRSHSREARRRYSRSPQGYHNRDKNRSRRRSGSRKSDISDRELWIRGRRRSQSRNSPARKDSRSRDSRYRNRSRSRDTPLRTMARKYEEKKREKKKSFLEEIREKLNEVSRPVVVPYSHHLHPPIAPQYVNTVSAPVPVPAPNQFFPQSHPVPTMQQQQYDQRFFIGESFAPAVDSFSPNVSINPQPVAFKVVAKPAPTAKPQVQSANVNISLPSVIQQVMNTVMDPAGQQKQIVTQQEQKKSVESAAQIDKLFADKKISLTDFLTITAKPEVHSSSPEQLQKKIKVISRCQDAIRSMSDGRKFSGRLSVQSSESPKLSERKSKSDGSFQSPLRKIPIVRFHFTTPAKAADESDSFAVALDRILMKVGLIKETVDLDDVSDDPAPRRGLDSGGFVDEQLLLPARPKHNKKNFDKLVCEECRKRKLKVFAEVGSQCVDKKETSSIATQVTEEDLNPKPRNDSLAYLTPAQLLAKSSIDNVNVNNNNKKGKNEFTPEKRNDNVNKGGGFRGGNAREPFRKAGSGNSGRGRPSFNNYEDDMEYDRGRPEFDNFEPFHRSLMFEPPQFQQQRQFMDSGRTMPMFRDEQDMFMDFNEPYRARNPHPNMNRFGPRF